MEALKFNLDQDNRPLKESITLISLESSPFKEQYMNSLTEIEAYLNTLNDKAFDKDTEYANNVFAFTGDRGAGKTSCMVSVGGLLTTKKELRKEFEKKYPNISKTDFYTLDLMDPSYFDTKHNILSLFLAKLYNAFQNLTRNNENIKECQKIEFITSLTKTQKHVHLLIGNESDSLITNKVEELECLSVAVDLKRDIKILIDKFFDCLDRQYQILLLRIDDIDLNAKEAGVMAELIRKYFIVPNILVLTALKIDQLEIIKRNEFANSFNLEKEDAQVTEMAERYLTKLFPHGQRVYLPDIEDLLNRKLVISFNSATYEYPSVQQCVLELIFKKTHYLFYNSPVHANYIIPRNLRDLRQMIKFLWNMEDYKETIDADFNILKIGRYNQTLFKKYLSEVWVNNNLDHKKYGFARRILYTDELMRLNSYVIRELECGYFTNEFIDVCTNDDNSICNISLGDALGLIEYNYNKTNNEQEQKFYFFVKTVYSIRLYEAYNKLSDEKKIPPIKRTTRNNKDITNEILRDGQYSNIRDFDKIVSGYYINVKLQPIFQKDLGLDHRFLDSKRIMDLMLFCESDFDVAANANLVRLLEFFMLSVSHNKELDGNFRKMESVIYDEPISLADNLVFDLGAFFFNLTRLKQCYARFRGHVKMSNGQDLVDQILHSEHSLYHDFMEFVKNKYACQYTCPYVQGADNYNDACSYYESRWLSCCSFRNIEILQDFLKFIQKFKAERNKSDKENLEAFFTKCAEYSIRIYGNNSVESETSCRKIQFDFLSKVAELLHQSNIDGYFVQIFGENPNLSKASSMEVH